MTKVQSTFAMLVVMFFFTLSTFSVAAFAKCPNKDGKQCEKCMENCPCKGMEGEALEKCRTENQANCQCAQKEGKKPCGKGKHEGKGMGKGKHDGTGPGKKEGCPYEDKAAAEAAPAEAKAAQ